MTQSYFLNENCFDTMARFATEEKKVDIILTSPPYNTARTSQTEWSIDNYENRYDVHLDNMTDDEYRDWTADLFNKFDAILEKDGVVLYNISYGSENPNSMWKAILSIIDNTNFMIADTIVWKKKSALPNNVSPNKLTRITEFVFVICRKAEFLTFRANKTISGESKAGQTFYNNAFNFIEAANNDGTCKLNKATYSTELCLKLLYMYAKRDYKIYDPFMGTGTTAAACHKFNGGNNDMICYGSELSEAQVAFSKKRIENIRREPTLCFED